MISTPYSFRSNWLQLLHVYQTHTKFFVIGSDNAETSFKILKIDRTDPKELILEEDKCDYSLIEIKEIIERLHAGNIGKTTSSWKNRGLVQTSTAFAIIGFVRFLEGYYMILVTKRAIVAEIGGHSIYKVEDTSMIYIPNRNVRISHPDESRYLKSFQMVDLSSNFYYSYSYDLTNSLQLNVSFQYLCNQISKNEDFSPKSECCESHCSTKFKVGAEPTRLAKKTVVCVAPIINERYVWNGFLKRSIKSSSIHSNWTINLIHGFLGQIKINIYGNSIYVTLIARRSSVYAGTRFLKRGCNILGNAANEVETEQIVHSASLTSFLKGQYTSYVQYRASVPVYWFQDITSSVVPAKPPITIALADPYAQATGKHFSQLFKKYGSPVIVLNLVKSHGRTSQEYHLGDCYKEALDYLNMFLPVKHKILYQLLDMAHLSRSSKSEVLIRLDNIAKENLHRTGFFQTNSELFNHTLQKNFSWNDLGGRKFGPFRLQTGVVRSNCVDCLDRTNSAQFIYAKCALAYQLFSLGVLPQPKIDFDTDAVRLFEELFEEHGDIIALQYGGSQLVHTIESYRHTAVLASHSRDIVTTLSRYYSNTFSDAYKQSAINLFLGVYQPEQQEHSQWDMITDSYLHNNQGDILKSFSSGKYTMWLDHEMMSVLCLPDNMALNLSTARLLHGCASAQTGQVTFDRKMDWFEEFYRVFEVTAFDDLYNMRMADSQTACLTNEYSDPSPFCTREDKWPQSNGRKVSDALSSAGSTDQSSFSDEEQGLEVRYVADEGIDVVRSGMIENENKNSLNEIDYSSSSAAYGDGIAWQPSRHDRNTYHRYLAVDSILNKFIPLSAFTQDSTHHVEPPTVDKYSRQAYERSVANSLQYPVTTLTSYKVYMEYVGTAVEPWPSVS